MESSDSTCKLKDFAKCHDKNVEKSVFVLQNVSFIQPIQRTCTKFFLHRKENYHNLSPVYISKLCWKEEYVRLFVLYGDVQHNADNRQNVVSHCNGEGEEKKF